MSRVGRRLVVVALVVGLGLAVAPLLFQMFSRTPKGGRMIKGFAPYMTTAKITAFRDDLDTIGAARHDVTATLLPGTAVDRYPTVATFVRQWPSIDDDMGGMLRTMRSDIGDYRAVAALPPFALFPWFFVLPGLAVAVLAGLALARDRGGRGTAARGVLWALAVVGVAVVAAPAVFQLFTRAPKGGEMIDDFRPLMTTERVTRIQGYFLTIATAEGTLRTQVLPAVPGGPATVPPRVAAFEAQWPHIEAEMAPMIGAMSDNVANFQAVAALPPFPLFPWFFVVPGLLVAGLALGAAPRRSHRDASPTRSARPTAAAPSTEVS